MINEIKAYSVDGVTYREIISKLQDVVPHRRERDLGATRTGGMYTAANEGQNKVSDRIYIPLKELLHERIIRLTEETVKQKLLKKK